MTTNKDWLNSLDSDELKAWLNADHSNDNLVPENVVTSDDVCSNTAFMDSRAKIEEDINHWLGSWTAFSVPISKVKEFVLSCLNRQIAIVCKDCEWPSLAAMPDIEMQAEIDKLTAELQASNQEREHWRNVCGRLIDKTHEMQSIYDEGLA